MRRDAATLGLRELSLYVAQRGALVGAGHDAGTVLKANPGSKPEPRFAKMTATMTSLAETFCASLPPGPPLDQAWLEQTLGRMISLAKQRYPGADAPADEFVRALARGFDRAKEAAAQLEAVRAADLWLVSACLAGSAVAERELARQLDAEIAKVQTRTSATLAPEDLRQLVWQKLFVAEAGSAPRAREYAGQAEVKSWLRVVIVRAQVDHSRKKSGGERVVDSERATEELLGASGDPEIEYLKRHYRGAFAAAFEQAVRGLDAEDRLILRQHYGDRLSVDQLAVVLGLHRATAARRVQRAREVLLSSTRRALMGSLGLSRGELESIMRLIESQLHVSVVRLLA